MVVKCPPMLRALMVEVFTIGRAAELPSHMRCSWGGRVSYCRKEGVSKTLCPLHATPSHGGNLFGASARRAGVVWMGRMDFERAFSRAASGLGRRGASQVGRSGECRLRLGSGRGTLHSSNYNNSFEKLLSD